MSRVRHNKAIIQLLSPCSWVCPFAFTNIKTIHGRFVMISAINSAHFLFFSESIHPSTPNFLTTSQPKVYHTQSAYRFPSLYYSPCAKWSTLLRSVSAAARPLARSSTETSVRITVPPDASRKTYMSRRKSPRATAPSAQRMRRRVEGNERGFSSASGGGIWVQCFDSTLDKIGAGHLVMELDSHLLGRVF